VFIIENDSPLDKFNIIIAGRVARLFKSLDDFESFADIDHG